MRAFVLGLLIILSSLTPALAYAQTTTPASTSDTEVLELAKVLQVSDERTETPPGTTVSSQVQTLQVEVLDGAEKGAVYTFDNDFTQLSVGNEFYLRHTHQADGTDLYAVSDPYRLPVIYALLAGFVILVFIFGGFQGIRGLLSLVVGLLLIFYLLLPGIIAGYSPVLVSIGVASLIVLAGSYVTHGFNRTTTAAVLGMIITVIITGFLAWYVVHAAQLSGYSTDESADLHFQFNGTIDLVGLLLSGILIGLLGVLYDIAIGQAVSVEELMRAGAHLTKREVYWRAIRIGREHIGALVNTLAIAYVGAALPLLLLFSDTTSLSYTVNSEIFATEIIRILIGSIGLVLAVPITTLISVYLVKPNEGQPSAHSHAH